eukprot:CAMPEP_0171102706 /NCGR_PEP_ID=MMETSP0766_2-20121228/58507_1 /TAXON_ID=439317 /ORGANISM="Gambierdiscus australes, Strain CAWD 149" /LENGTH=165 /DNA_ID=CAMNT_0011563051 /DNA_START=119 /DNA_END=616 /DNA_ORIENTATION=-
MTLMTYFESSRLPLQTFSWMCHISGSRTPSRPDGTLALTGAMLQRPLLVRGHRSGEPPHHVACLLCFQRHQIACVEELRALAAEVHSPPSLCGIKGAKRTNNAVQVGAGLEIGQPHPHSRDKLGAAGGPRAAVAEVVDDSAAIPRSNAELRKAGLTTPYHAGTDA